MKIASTVIALCLILVLPCLAAVPIGEVISISGTVTATDEDGQGRKLELKSPINLNDKVVTAKGSKIQILLDDDSVISEGDGSELLIDDFVYDPEGGDKGSCSVKLAKGVFRVVTGKITELNPERFKVKTKMATIGIRGCELGFRIRPDREDIYVLELPSGHSVEITKLLEELVEATGEGLGRTLNITTPNAAVTLQAGLEMRQRSISPEERSQLIMDGGGSGRSGGRAILSQGEGGTPAVSLQHELEVATVAANQTVSSLNKLENVRKPPQIASINTFSGPKTAPVETQPPANNEPPILVGGHPELSSWEWGIWEDGTIQYSGNRYMGDSFLTTLDYDNIVAGSTYTLVDDGMGQAAAVVHYGGQSKLLDMGSCQLKVEVGGAAVPRWGGYFSMMNMGGDSLSFSVDYDTYGGSIGPGGSMGLNSLSAYSLLIPGQPTLGQGSLTSQSISGNLIKPAGGSPAINGAAGEFHFTHGTDAQVDGAFGANLQ